MRQPKLWAVILLLVTAAAGSALAAPGAFTLVGSGQCNGTSPAIALSWSASSGATSYTVFRNGSSIATLGSQTTAYNDSAPISGTFTYFIRATDGNGTTDSNSVQVSVPNCLPAPGAFTLSGNEYCDNSTQTRKPGVHLSWTASSNATSYDVYQHNGRIGQGLSASVRSVDITSSEFFVGAQPQFYIVAVNNTGTTHSNTIVVPITSNACPPLPTAPTLSGNAACDNSTNPAHAIVNLTWTTSANATGYQIFRNNSAYAAATSTNYTDNNVTPGESYSYFVRATNSGGSADSNTISVPVSANICGTPPGAFTLSGNAACNAGAGGVHLSWSASSGATGYNVFRNNAKIAGPITATSYDDTTGLTVGSTYSYRVDAINASGTTQSSDVPVNVSGPNCGPPGGFVVNGVTPFCTNGASPSPALRVTWSPSSGATSYVVNRDGLPRSGSLSSSTTSYEDTTVTPGQTYNYTVTATNGGGSTLSTGANGTAATSCAPPVPSAPALSSSIGCAGQPSSPVVKLTWTAASNANNYTVYRNGAPYSGLLPSSTLSFDDAAVTAGQGYTYVVRASNPSGSTDSNQLTVTISAGTCQTAPSDFGLNATAFCDRSGTPSPAVRLSWTASSGVTTYNIFRDGNQIATVVASTQTYADTNVVSGRSYSYFVRAIGSGGTTNSNTVNVTPSSSNCASAGAPDLLPLNAIISPPSVLAGDQISITLTVSNQGDATASATTTRIRLGSNAATASVVASLPTPAIAPGATSTMTASITVPTVPPGTYFLFITVDDDHIVPQSNTANDTLQSDPIHVRANSCTTECGATVVQTAAVGSVVGLALTNGPVCAGATVSWNFGDGAVAVGDTTTHIYATAGTYSWSLTVSANGASCQSSGTIVITSGSHPPRRRVAGH
jgi:fibronectin type 3 domain-containing protein